MSYDKHTWTTGEVVAATKLNNIENGIETLDTTKSVVSGTSEGSNWTSLTINGTAKNIGEGKAWSEITLSGQDVVTLASGGQIVRSIYPSEPTRVYDPTNFKNDYFKVKVEQKGVNGGNLVYPGEDFTSLKVSIDSFNPSTNNAGILTYLAGTLVNEIQNSGFEHNYYKTLMLFSGTNSESLVKTGENVFDSQNTVYVQDVSQQKWEYNTYAEAGGKEVGQSREQSNIEIYGRALVFSFKGAAAANDKAFIYCLQDSQAAFWYQDSETSGTRWANMTAGKFYPVYFDTTHDTLRWLLSNVTYDSEYDEYNAVEMTNTEKGAYLDGFTFGANLKSAVAMEDTAGKSGCKVVGCEYGWFERVFSFNRAFESTVDTHLEYLGRPNGYLLNTITYEKGGEQHIEKDGEHVWVCDVEGTTIELIIPDNIYEDGTAGLIPHRDTYIMQINTSSATQNNRLYRHTFTVKPYEDASFDSGETIARVTFCAVNAQAGDSSPDYLLHSDEVGQAADWVLPCSGVVGIATGEGQAVSAWYPALRIVAGWKEIQGSEDYVRCIYVNYFDTSTSVMEKVELLRDDNAYKYNVGDFRTDILTVKSPYSGYKY